jgi:folate-binding protein YgfZ
MTAAIDWLGVLAIRGPDALAFSHSQLANDVKALPDGGWQWNALLSIKGRVLALMLLLRTGPQEVLLVLPRELRETTRATLARYVLRSKLTLEPDDGLHVTGVLGDRTGWHPEPPATGGTIEQSPDGTLSIDLAGTHARRLCLRPWRTADGEDGLESTWRVADVADGIPWIVPATADAFIPQALGLERLRAFSVSKGCYPGQEIVARTHFLGRSRRVLRRFDEPWSEPAPAAGTTLRASPASDAAAAATVIATVRRVDRMLGLAVAVDAETVSAYFDGHDGIAAGEPRAIALAPV